MYTNLRTGQRCATGFRLSGVLCASDQIPESRCALPFEPRKHVVYPERRSSAVVYRGRSAQREDDRVVYPGPSRSDALCTRNVRPAALCTEVRVRNAVVRSSSGEQGVRKCGLTSNQCTQVVRQCAVTAISCQTCTQALRSSWADLARRDPTHLDAKDIRRLVPARRTSRGRASVTTGRAPPPTCWRMPGANRPALLSNKRTRCSLCRFVEFADMTKRVPILPSKVSNPRTRRTAPDPAEFADLTKRRGACRRVVGCGSWGGGAPVRASGRIKHVGARLGGRTDAPASCAPGGARRTCRAPWGVLCAPGESAQHASRGVHNACTLTLCTRYGPAAPLCTRPRPWHSSRPLPPSATPPARGCAAARPPGGAAGSPRLCPRCCPA